MAVYSFDDLDDMFNSMRRDMNEADSRVKPWQAKIKAGDYFVRRSGLGFNIYGEILHEEEPRAQGLGHYRLCRGYSIACPKGEMGDIHVSTIEALLTREEFVEAKRSGWRYNELEGRSE